MNSTLKISLAFLAGILAYGIYDKVTVPESSTARFLSDADSLPEDSSAIKDCACDNAARYTSTSPVDAQNFVIADVPTCQSMVKDPAPTGGKVIKRIMGAWFSKKTLDVMFCKMMDANGIFVYKGVMPEDATDTVFVIEAAHTDAYLLSDTTSGTMYYSRSLCPDMCGACAE